MTLFDYWELGSVTRLLTEAYQAVQPPRCPNRQADRQRRRRTAYVKYLESPEWKAFKSKIAALRGLRCERCGSKPPLDLHHKTYRRFGHEEPQDVELLCRTCHESHHRVQFTPRRRVANSGIRP